MNIVTRYVMFDPHFFTNEEKRSEKSALFIKAMNETNDEIKNSLKVEDFKSSIRRALGQDRLKVFNLLGTRRVADKEDDHFKEYKNFMSKRIVF